MKKIAFPRIGPLLASWLVFGSPGPAMAAPEKAADVRFAALTLPTGLESVVMAAGESRSKPFALPLNHLTDPLKAPARDFQIQLPEHPRALTKVKLPQEGAAFIVLLVPGVEAVFEAVVIPARGGRFQPGDYYLHNVSSKTVLAKVGTTQTVIPPRRGEFVRPQGAREDRFYDVALGVREDGASRVISTSRWPVGGRMRTYVFFFDDPQREDVSFRAIDEFVPGDDPVPER